MKNLTKVLSLSVDDHGHHFGRAGTQPVSHFLTYSLLSHGQARGTHITTRELDVHPLIPLQMLKADPALVTPGRLMDLLLTYRDLKSWDDMIRLINVCSMPTVLFDDRDTVFHSFSSRACLCGK
jgi:hypothetical protein